MKTLIFSSLIGLIFIISCSQINTESRNYYQQKKESNANHGFAVRLSVKSIDDLDYKKTPFGVDSLERGKELYQKYCMKCHGKNGEGDGPFSEGLEDQPLNLKEAVKSTPYFKLFVDLSKNTLSMPGWSQKDFSKEELEDISHYLRKLALE